MDPLFPPLPEDITGLTADQIQALIDERLAIVKAVGERDADVIGDRSAESVVAELKKGVEDVKALKGELAARDEAEAAAEQAIAELTKELMPDASEDGDEAEADAAEEDDAEDDDKEKAPEGDKVPALAASSRPLRTRKRQEPAPAKQPARTTLVASAGVDGFAEGHKFGSARELAQALVNKRRSMTASAAGNEEKVLVARHTYEFPEDRTLKYGDDTGNWEKIQEAVTVGVDANGNEALVASGGLCAPVTPYYDLEVVAVASRPVRDALPVFNATRGGIRYAPPPGLATVTTGVGYLTAAQDQTGGTTGAKTCQTIPCPSFTEVDVAMIYQCLRFGNLGARAWPEQVTQFQALVTAARARLAETKLLDGISAASIATTGAAVAGAAATVLGQMLMAAAGQRSRLRMGETATVRVLMPAWGPDALVADVIRSQFGRFDFTRDDVERILRANNIAPSFYLDGHTGAAQVFGTQSAGALLSFPATMQWFMFPEGSFLFLDAGTLDVGLVRDSTLNLTNDFQMFEENFENIAFIGVESLQVTSTICVNGQVSAPATIAGCAA